VKTLSHSSIKVNKVHAAEHLLCSSSVLQVFHPSGYIVWWKLTNVLEETTSSVSTIKMKEPTVSNCMAENEGMINSYQSTWCHNQDNSSLYRHCYESLKYHSKAKNATNISSSIHKIASCPNIWRNFRIKIIANKQ
jgi:hypothetical protein